MKIDEKQIIAEFLNQFYHICSSIDSTNYTLDQFYDDFPVEMHEFMTKFVNNTISEVKNG